MITVDSISKLYGEYPAVWDVSFSVARGEVVGLLGPNGAGKTTLMRILAGFSAATFGTATINGYDIYADSLRARASLGYLPENNPLYPELRIDEYLVWRAKIKGVPAKDRTRAVERAMGATYMIRRRKQIIGTLSKGLGRRVGLADALLGNPPLLILDEPTGGLDPIQQREVRDLITELRSDTTILLSTHILPEVEKLASRTLIINAGQLAPDSLADAIRKRVAYRLTVAGAAFSAIQAALSEFLPPDAKITDDGASGNETNVVIRPAAANGAPEAADLRERIYRACAERQFRLLELRRMNLSLEDVFAEIVTGAAQTGASKPAAAKTEGAA